MKLITAVIRPDKLDDVVSSIVDNGARGLTVTEILGFGRQYGQLSTARSAAGLGAGPDVSLLPKARLDIVVRDDQADSVASAIAKCAGTGTIGDGKIWVTDVASVLRVRTGERDDDAV